MRESGMAWSKRGGGVERLHPQWVYDVYTHNSRQAVGHRDARSACLQRPLSGRISHNRTLRWPRRETKPLSLRELAEMQSGTLVPLATLYSPLATKQALLDPSHSPRGH